MWLASRSQAPSQWLPDIRVVAGRRRSAERANAVSPPGASQTHDWSDQNRVLPPCVRLPAFPRAIVLRVSRLDRITSQPEVCHGQPAIRGLRYTVECVLELLSAGMTIEQVLADYPDLERDDILAALELGARAAGRRRVVPLSAA